MIIAHSRWPAFVIHLFSPPKKNQVAGHLTLPVIGAGRVSGIVPQLMPHSDARPLLHPDRRPNNVLVPRSGTPLITPLSLSGVPMPAPGGGSHQYLPRPGSLSSKAGRSKPGAELHGFHHWITGAGPAALPATQVTDPTMFDAGDVRAGSKADQEPPTKGCLGTGPMQCGRMKRLSPNPFDPRRKMDVKATDYGPRPFEVTPETEGPSHGRHRAGTRATSQKTKGVVGTIQTSVHRYVGPRPKNQEEEEPRYNFLSPRNPSSYHLSNDLPLFFSGITMGGRSASDSVGRPAVSQADSCPLHFPGTEAPIMPAPPVEGISPGADRSASPAPSGLVIGGAA
jgi:hypothetical protein